MWLPNRQYCILQRKSFGSLSALLQCWFRLASHHGQGWFGLNRTNPVCDVYQMCLNPEVGTRENRKSIERAQILLCYARINGNVIGSNDDYCK